MVDLYQFQRTGATFLANRDKALLGDEMGLGKTPQAILACDMIGAGSVLVICPAVARDNWAREFARFQQIKRPILVIANSTGTQTPVKGGVLVCSYDLASREKVNLVLHAALYDVLILDEVHYLKCRRTTRTKTVFGAGCDGIGGLTGLASRVYALTGTPTPNNHAELWPILNALFPGAITNGKGHCMDYWSFIRRYCECENTDFGVKVTGGKNTDELRSRLRPYMLRRLKKAVLPDLPQIRFETVTLKASGGMAALIRMEKGPEGDAVRAALAADQDLKTVAVNLAKLRRITGMLKTEPLIDLVIGDLIGGMDKIVIFAHHMDVIQALAVGLSEFGVVVIHGSIQSKARADAIDRFQYDPRIRVFIGQITAAGTAITLTAASNVLFAESSWTPADNAQAAMRVHRIGQKDSVLIRFATLAGSLDEAITETVRRKTAVLAQLFD